MPRKDASYNHLMTQVASAPAAFQCPRCGNWLYNGTLVCPSCRGLVYAQRLNELAAEAQRQEPTSPIAAAQLWQQCLPLLPPDSQQFQVVRDRIGVLLAQMGIPVAQQFAPPRPVPRPRDPWPLALAKTGGSMLICILIYSTLFGPDLATGFIFATGFVLLILIHELGHVFAMRYYGLRAGPPIFIPFLGALINLREPPKNALQEAVVGIGGPVLGALGAIACFVWYLKTHSDLALNLAYVGFFLNLFNLLPVPPLDGGRVTAAVSPWIWIPGLFTVVARLGYDYYVNHHSNFILILLLIFAWPRIKQTLILRGRDLPYYRIGRKAMWAMGAAYVILGVTLTILFLYAESQAQGLRIRL